MRRYSTYELRRALNEVARAGEQADACRAYNTLKKAVGSAPGSALTRAQLEKPPSHPATIQREKAPLASALLQLYNAGTISGEEFGKYALMLDSKGVQATLHAMPKRLRRRIEATQ
jgi:hypothetical protein